jgi:hypothetical protein
MSNNILNIGLSQFNSRDKYYLIDTTISKPTNSYVFNTLEDLYLYGCVSYLPMGMGAGVDMMQIFDWKNVTNTYYASDIPNRQCLYNVYIFNCYSSIGAYSDYNYSVNMRCKITDYGSSPTNPRHLFIDTSNDDGKYGCVLGLADGDLYATVRTSSGKWEAKVSLSSIGIGLNEWFDVGYSLYTSDTSTGFISLYVDGNIMCSGSVPVGLNYNGDISLVSSRYGYNIYDNNTYDSINYNYITELSMYDRVLTPAQFSGISYTQKNKPLAMLWNDYSVLLSDYTPQVAVTLGSTTYYYGLRAKYICHQPTSNIMYMVADRGVYKFDYLHYSWEKNAVTTLNNHSDIDLSNPELVGGFISSVTDDVCSVVYSSNVDGSLFFNSSFYGNTRYVDEGSYVSPVIDTLSDNMFMYSIDYTSFANDTVDLYLRYAKYPPLDYAHLHYCSSTNFYEKSIVTGKVFNSFTVSDKNSCAVHYDDNMYKVTLDGRVYYNSNYNSAVYTFKMLSYTLTGIKQTWFSYNGNFILYMLNDGYMAGFPLGLGYACTRVKPSFSSVYDVSWSKFSDSFVLRTDIGVVEYNYKLGVVYKSADYIYKFYTNTCVVYVKSDGSCVITSNDYKHSFKYTIVSLDSTKRVVHDYDTDFLFYISTVSSEIHKVRFSVVDGTFKYETYNINVSGISDIYMVNSRYIAVYMNALLTVFNHNGNILAEYEIVNMDSGGLVFHKYSNEHKISYYGSDYISSNDLIWFDMMPWINLGHKNRGIIRGNRYVQFKTVLKSSTDNSTTPILERIYVGGPVVVGPIPSNSFTDFYVTVDIPIDDSCDIYSTKIESYFETLLFDEDI